MYSLTSSCVCVGWGMGFAVCGWVGGVCVCVGGIGSGVCSVCMCGGGVGSRCVCVGWGAGCAVCVCGKDRE